MKKNQLFSTLFISFFISTFLLSCKKNTETAKRDCKIVALTSGSNAIAFTYDADGRLSAKISATAIDKFAYNGNTIIITNSTGSVINTITTVILNANGLAANVSTSDSAGTNFFNTALEYNGTELSKSTSSSFPGGDTTITTYTYSGGNLVSSQSGSNITTFNYSSDILSQDGDFWNNVNLQQGYEIFKTKNAVTSVESDGNISTTNYDFDAEGKIISLTGISNGTVLTINYQYQCN